MSMTAAATADATAVPILEIGRAWMSAPTTQERAVELGLSPGFSFWVNGRAGALGDVSAEVAAGAIGFMAPAQVAEMWNSRPEALSANDAAVAYAEVGANWGRQSLSAMSDADLSELAELATMVADAALPIVGPLFAAWRELDRPTDPAGSATHGLQLLREMRGGAHLSAVQAAGLTPQHAILSFTADQIRGGPSGAERFGWVAPHPAPNEAARAEAEVMTTTAVVPAYAALSPERQQRFVDLVLEARAQLGEG